MLSVMPDIVLNALHVSYFTLITVWFDVIFILQLRKLNPERLSVFIYLFSRFQFILCASIVPGAVLTKVIKRRRRRTKNSTVRELLRNLPKVAELLTTELGFGPRQSHPTAHALHRAGGTSHSFMPIVSLLSYQVLDIYLCLFSILTHFHTYFLPFPYSIFYIHLFCHIHSHSSTLRQSFLVSSNTVIFVLFCFMPTPFIFLLPLSPSSPSFTSFPFTFFFPHSPYCFPSLPECMLTLRGKGVAGEPADLVVDGKRGSEKRRAHSPVVSEGGDGQCAPGKRRTLGLLV